MQTEKRLYGKSPPKGAQSDLIIRCDNNGLWDDNNNDEWMPDLNGVRSATEGDFFTSPQKKKCKHKNGNGHQGTRVAADVTSVNGNGPLSRVGKSFR